MRSPMSILRKRGPKVIDSREIEAAGKEFWDTHPHPLPDVPLNKWGLPDLLPEPEDPDDDYEMPDELWDEPKKVTKVESLEEMRAVLERRYGLPPR